MMPFSAKEHKILIVDDDVSIRFFLGELLKKEGFQFDIAGTGPEAITLLKITTTALCFLMKRCPA